MASTSSSTLTISSSSTLVDGKAPRQSPSSSPQCVTLPSLPPPPSPWKTTAFCRRIARNVMAMATTGEATAPTTTTTEIATTTAELGVTEVPEFVKTIQQAWDKVEDKYTVSSLAVAAGVALVGSAGAISAIDRLPLIPGVLEVVGIGYTGWFAYKNLIFKPDREALVRKIKETYNEIIGSS